MNLPVIDIPLELPFEVPLMVHPIFVHFAIAIPVIVFLLEIANIKARNRAVSVTSLFLMTLALVVYAGAFFTGKADGSHAFAMLSADAKEELKFHKLLGTYLVYGMGILYLLKLLAMLVKKPWARDLFLAMLLVFIGVTFKQGKDGGELVYEYGVNVKAVTELQDKIDDMEYEIEDLKKAKESSAKEATETPSAQEAAPAEEGTHETPATNEEAAPAGHEKAAPAATEHETAPEPEGHETSAPAEGAHEENIQQNPAEAVQEAVESAHEEATKVGEEAVQHVEESAEHSGEAVKEALHETAEQAGEAAAAESSEEAAPTH